MDTGIVDAARSRALADLASARVGGRAVAANDEFFAPKSNLVKPEPAIFVPGKFTARGKWMDGWETRRRRTPGHDWCVVALGMRGRDPRRQRRHEAFHGQLPVALFDRGDRQRPARHLQPCAPRKAQPWVTILAKSPLRGDSDNFLPIADDRPVDARADSTSFPTAAWPGCASTATCRWTGCGCPGGGARSTLRRSRTAASSSARATCTSAPRTT